MDRWNTKLLMTNNWICTNFLCWCKLELGNFVIHFQKLSFLKTVFFKKSVTKLKEKQFLVISILVFRLSNGIDESSLKIKVRKNIFERLDQLISEVEFKHIRTL